MPQDSFTSEGLDDLFSIAQNILIGCNNRRIFAFSGALGVGKTTLIQRLCAVLGVSEPVTSPTFNLVNEYVGKNGSVFHFDLYRIEDEEEAYDIGLYEYFDSGAYCFVEWPERIPSLMPSDTVQISITTNSRHHRHIEIIS